MQSKSIHMTGLSFLVVLIAAISTQGMFPDKGSQPVFPHFPGLNKEKADEASNRLLTAHQQLVVGLIEQFRSERSSDEARTYIAFVLGELRAAQAVTALVERIDLEAPWVDPKIKIGRWGQYPVAEALRKIGFPAAHEIAAKLVKEENKTRRKLMLGVIKELYTVEAGRCFLQRSAAKVKNPEWKKQLERAAEELEKLDR